MKNGLIQEGDRIITTTDFPAGGMAIYSAPYSSGFDCVIPANTLLIADQDQVPGAPSFVCLPERYKDIEELLVPKSERSDKYVGYYLVCRGSAIGAALELITE